MHDRDEEIYQDYLSKLKQGETIKVSNVGYSAGEVPPFVVAMLIQSGEGEQYQEGGAWYVRIKERDSSV